MKWTPARKPWKALSLTGSAGAILISLTTFLTGCAKAPPARPIVFSPPAILLDDVKIPPRDQMKTVGDMARIIVEDEQAMRLKNADMQALREYRASLLEIAQ